MSQTLKTLINNIAAEVADLQDTKADRVELNACVRSVGDEPGQTTQLISLVKTGSTLRLNTENLRAVLNQIDPDLGIIDLQNFINNVITDNEDPEEYLKITSEGQDLHVDYSKLLTLVNSKAPNTSLSSYIKAASTATSTSPTLITVSLTPVADGSGKELQLDYSGIQDALDGKADAEVPQFFMNYYFRYATQASRDPTKLVYMTYEKGTAATPDRPVSIPLEGATIGLELRNLVNALEAKAPLNNPTFTGTVSGINKDAVGLSNVDNTSDNNKPISADAASPDRPEHHRDQPGHSHNEQGRRCGP